jgi:hypothetical protein
MSRIECTTLPPAEIDHPAVAAASKKHAEAQQALQTARRELKKLDERAEQAARDADARAAFEGNGKRTHLAAFRKQVDDAQHNVRVARLAARDAHQNFQQAVDDNLAGWADDVAEHAELVNQAWNDALAALARLHSDRVRAHRRCRILGVEVAPVGSVRFTPSRLFESLSGDPIAAFVGPDLSPRSRVSVPVEDVLGALQAIGEPEPAPPMHGSFVADQIARSAKHVRDLQRGYTDEEARADGGRSINTGSTFLNGVPISVYVPGSDEGEL